VTVPIYLNGDSHRLFACVATLESLAAKTAAHGFIVVGKLRFSRVSRKTAIFIPSPAFIRSSQCLSTIKAFLGSFFAVAASSIRNPQSAIRNPKSAIAGVARAVPSVVRLCFFHVGRI
jgi:hypothetical protein